MKLIEGFDSNYRYILVAPAAPANSGGAPPVVETIPASPAASRKTKSTPAR